MNVSGGKKDKEGGGGKINFPLPLFLARGRKGGKRNDLSTLNNAVPLFCLRSLRQKEFYFRKELLKLHTGSKEKRGMGRSEDEQEVLFLL